VAMARGPSRAVALLGAVLTVVVVVVVQMWYGNDKWRGRVPLQSQGAGQLESRLMAPASGSSLTEDARSGLRGLGRRRLLDQGGEGLHQVDSSDARQEGEDELHWRARIKEKGDNMWSLKKKEAERDARRQACFKNWKPSCRRIVQWHIKTGRMKDPNPVVEEDGADGVELEDGAGVPSPPAAASNALGSPQMVFDGNNAPF